MIMTDKIFCGSGKQHIFDSGAVAVNCMIVLSDIPKEHIFTVGDGKKAVRIKVTPKRNQEEGKPSHYCEVDTWRPEPKAAEPEIVRDVELPDDDSDLPF